MNEQGLIPADELASEEETGCPSYCRGSEPLPTFQTQLEIAVASHRRSRAAIILRSSQKLASCSAKVVVRWSNTIHLVMLWGWFDVASAETRFPSLLGLLGLNFCLQLRLPQASTSHQLEFPKVSLKLVAIARARVFKLQVHIVLSWIPGFRLRKWTAHMRLVLPDDAHSFASFWLET